MNPGAGHHDQTGQCQYLSAACHETAPLRACAHSTPQASEELRRAMARISDKWSFHVINQVAGHTMRFSELLRAVDGISSRMLTETVRKLERDGIISRHIGTGISPPVHYALTTIGYSLLNQLGQLDQWINQHRDAIAETRRHYDEHHR